MRSVDFIVFLLFVVPTLVCEHLEAESSLVKANALASLVTACAIALSWEIDQDDLQRMQR